MKELILIILCALTLTVNGQSRKETYSYRPAPKVGEWLCIGGILGGAIGASEILGYENKFNSPIIYASILTCCIGVAIDIHGRKINSYKYKHKVKTSLFGHRNTFGVRIKF